MSLDERLRALIPEIRDAAHAAGRGARVATDDDTASDEDLRQMVDGFLGILDEELSGTRSERRTFFVETVIPSLVEKGVDPWGVVAGSTYFSVVVACELVGRVSVEERVAATTRLGNFFAGYVTQLGRVGVEAKPS